MSQASREFQVHVQDKDGDRSILRLRASTAEAARLDAKKRGWTIVESEEVTTNPEVASLPFHARHPIATIALGVILGWLGVTVINVIVLLVLIAVGVFSNAANGITLR